MNIRSALPFFVLALFFSCAAMTAVPAGADAATHERMVRVDPGLLAEGVKATTVTVPSEGVHEPPVATVFITFERPFQGELYVSGFRRDGAEIARSEFVRINEARDAGGNIRFPFDKDTRLTEVSVFTLYGTRKPVPARPAKKEESFGEATENIVKELLQ